MIFDLVGVGVGVGVKLSWDKLSKFGKAKWNWGKLGLADIISVKLSKAEIRWDKLSYLEKALLNWVKLS